MPGFQFIHGLLRSYDPNFQGFFTSIDTADNFYTIKNSQPPDWEYHDKAIYYRYNSLGHRSVELSDLQDDYLLFTGCSVTEGVSLAEEDIYPTIVSKTLDKNFYNLGVGGSSPAITVKNLIAFLSFVKVYPQAIIIQWPFFQRYFDISTGYHIQHYSPACKASSLYKEMLTNNDAFRYNVVERNFMLHYLKNIGFCGKIVEMFNQTHSEIKTIGEVIPSELNTIRFKLPHTVDYGRDLGHPGSKTHKLYADIILKHL